jgi:ribosomal protein S18 acetylase RimI-like enzyme
MKPAGGRWSLSGAGSGISFDMEPPVQTDAIVRSATYPDATAIVALDPSARAQQSRANFIYRSITARTCYVAELNARIIGYGVLEYTFFEHGFIPLVLVAAEHRRQGVASALVRHMEKVCKTPKLFTTTAKANTTMQSLLKKLGYRRSGTIQNLSDGDPELVFFKKLR